MKTILFLCALTIFCGCKPQPDPRIEKLEARVDELEKNLLEVNQNTVAISTNLNQKIDAYMPVVDAMAKQIDVLTYTTTNILNGRVVPGSVK